MERDKNSNGSNNVDILLSVSLFFFSFHDERVVEIQIMSMVYFMFPVEIAKSE